MIHVWLIKPQSNLRVWDASLNGWQTVESWQALHDSAFVKANDSDVCLYLPTGSVLSLSNTLSEAQIKQLGETGQQYLFEDVSLSPVEQLRVRHLSLGEQSLFYALGTQEIEQWQHQAQLSGYRVVALLPDFVLLPVPQANTRHGKEVTVYQDQAGEGVLIRQSKTQGLSVNSLPLLARMFTKLLPNVDEINLIKGYEPQSEQATDNLMVATDANAVTTGSSHNATSLQKIADDHGIVITLSQQSLQPVAHPIKHGLNFVEIKRNRLASPYLTLAASVLLLAGGVQILADAIESYQYKQATIATRAATENQFSSWFNGEKLNPKVNVTTQVQPRLIKGGDQSQEQLSVLSRVSPIIKQSQLVAESVQWNDGQITLVIKGSSRDGIDQLQRTLSAQGVTANLGVINPTSDGGVAGELTIPLTSTSESETEGSSPANQDKSG